MTPVPVRLFQIASGLLLVFGAAACALPESPASLEGEWKFRTGFSEEFLHDREMTAPAWRTVRVPLRYHEIPDFETYRGWITLRTELPVGAVRPFWLGQEVGLYSGWVSDVARLYINDRQFGQVGSTEPYVPGYSRFYLGPVPAAAISDRNYLTIALYSSDRFPAALFDLDIAMGRLEGVFFEFYGRELVTLMFIGVYMSVGVYHFLLWRKRRQELYNLFFGLFTATVSMYWLHRSNLREFFYADYQLVRLKLELLLLFAAGPLLVFFLSHLLRRKYDLLGKIFAAICAALALAVLFPGFIGTMNILRFWQYISIFGLVYVVYYITREARAGNREARYIAIGQVVLMLAIFHDLIAAMDLINNPHIARFAFFLFISGIAILLANRFVEVHRQVEELNANLEEKVRDRTIRLENTLTEIREIKEQQDGDYFLTSLLLRPLGGNAVRSPVIGVETLVRQNKQFQFRNWQAEIGGDLAAADLITLRGRRYVAVLNGDAMGKSIQGAGGALVLGTAFRSLLERTRVSSDLARLDPELWLKQCFDELQSVFATFDGTMLVSLVLGLVDEESGFLYYVNAEHPFVVLYRARRADFIEPHVRFRKVGITGLEGGLMIRTFALQPGDVLFIGSDGRDDLVIGTDEQGNRIINENEREFLKRIEEADGDLARIERLLLNWGTLTDDLSIIRVAYREDLPAAAPGDAPEHEATLAEARTSAAAGAHGAAIEQLESARRAAPDHPVLARELAVLYAKTNRMDRALSLGRQYSTMAPGDTAWLSELALLFFQAGDFREAVRFAERMRLREPDHRESLSILMAAYVRLGRPDLASKYVERLLALDPGHAAALAMKQTLAGSVENQEDEWQNQNQKP